MDPHPRQSGLEGTARGVDDASLLSVVRRRAVPLDARDAVKRGRFVIVVTSLPPFCCGA